MARWTLERSFIAELSVHQICVLRPRSHTLISSILQYGDALTHIRLTTQDFEEVPPIFTRKIESKSSLCSSGYRLGWGTGELSSRPEVQAITEGNYSRPFKAKSRTNPNQDDCTERANPSPFLSV
jgi:hypothetical protein